MVGLGAKCSDSDIFILQLQAIISANHTGNDLYILYPLVWLVVNRAVLSLILKYLKEAYLYVLAG